MQTTIINIEFSGSIYMNTFNKRMTVAKIVKEAQDGNGLNLYNQLKLL